MLVKVLCGNPNCDASYSVTSEEAGRLAECPKCGWAETVRAGMGDGDSNLGNVEDEADLLPPPKELTEREGDGWRVNADDRWIRHDPDRHQGFRHRSDRLPWMVGGGGLVFGRQVLVGGSPIQNSSRAWLGGGSCFTIAGATTGRRLGSSIGFFTGIARRLCPRTFTLRGLADACQSSVRQPEL
jgi:hypothetical protein